MCPSLQVQVVHEKSTGDVYAMKVMNKAHILQQADVCVYIGVVCTHCRLRLLGGLCIYVYV